MEVDELFGIRKEGLGQMATRRLWGTGGLGWWTQTTQDSITFPLFRSNPSNQLAQKIQEL
jgi:hypothetical protein